MAEENIGAGGDGPATDEGVTLVRKIAESLDKIATSLHNIEVDVQDGGQVDKRLRQIAAGLLGQMQLQQQLSQPGTLDAIVMTVLERLRR